MSYRKDRDLEVLAQADNEDLKILVHYLTRDKDGDLRLTEELTSKSAYISNKDNPKMYWREIAEELQRFGGNTLVNMFRGGGVTYREVLCDVCDKMKVNYNEGASTELIEMNMFQKFLTDVIYKIDDDKMREIIKDLDLKTTDFTKQGVVAALQMAIRFGGFSPYKLAVIVANGFAKNLVGRGLPFVMNQGFGKVISAFAGPIGWAITALWTVVDIAGPAYRVTIPAVIQVAYIRVKAHMK